MISLFLLFAVGGLAVDGALPPGEVAAVLLPPSMVNIIPVPLGEFVPTGQKENYANYVHSLEFEFRGLAAQGILGDKGKDVRHKFSRSADGKENSYVHKFGNDGGGKYNHTVPFVLDEEKLVHTNATSLKYKYWFEPGQGLHADYNIPPENPLQIQHLYAVTDEGFTLIYKLGNVIAKNYYKRAPSSDAAPEVTSKTTVAPITTKKKA
ncbi:hypothetical protein BV898_17244 [Hypsibius exemplaris]|uniref:Uncharacterized protein n=1 Tax=Hypsibius exemplaris TaxID=2072580 RepID=A0A9X6NHQ0_HYPEX|nr:hypothetical protein BV898_17244 [Hypsibius exemplaris]